MNIDEALQKGNEAFALDLYRDSEKELSQSQRKKAFGLIRAYRQKPGAASPAVITA